MPAELPGRGSRLREPAFVSLAELVNALTITMEQLLDKPFALFGHSMGAVIAFELARSVRLRYDREPEWLFVSGRRAPQIPHNDPPTFNLPKDQFIAELRRIAGTPTEVLEHEELMEYLIPLLRADFQLIQTYSYKPDARLDCPITAWAGLSDRKENRGLVEEWREQTSSAFALHMLPGDHFFLRSSETRLLQTLARELELAVVNGRLKAHQ
jgi:medium-chain acyl-[acyl-carrier-protein] hydrolase